MMMAESNVRYQASVYPSPEKRGLHTFIGQYHSTATKVDTYLTKHPRYTMLICEFVNEKISCH